MNIKKECTKCYKNVRLEIVVLAETELSTGVCTGSDQGRNNQSQFLDKQGPAPNCHNSCDLFMVQVKRLEVTSLPITASEPITGSSQQLMSSFKLSVPEKGPEVELNQSTSCQHCLSLVAECNTTGISAIHLLPTLPQLSR